jgi:hypothetical protein
MDSMSLNRRINICCLNGREIALNLYLITMRVTVSREQNVGSLMATHADTLPLARYYRNSWTTTGALTTSSRVSFPDSFVFGTKNESKVSRI